MNFVNYPKNHKFILKNDADDNIEYQILELENLLLQNINLNNYKKSDINEFNNNIIIYDCRNLLYYNAPNITINTPNNTIEDSLNLNSDTKTIQNDKIYIFTGFGNQRVRKLFIDSVEINLYEYTTHIIYIVLLFIQ